MTWCRESMAGSIENTPGYVIESYGENVPINITRDPVSNDPL